MVTFTGPDGVDYALGHLAPFTFNFELRRKGGVIRVPLYVTFSNHTYSRDPIEGDDRAWFLPVELSSQERHFCKDRWDFSHRLPELVRAFLLCGKGTCRILDRSSSYLRIERDGPNQFVGWYLFFDIERRTGERSMRLTFRSVHHRDTLPGNDLGKSPVPIWKLIDQRVPK